MCIWIGCELVLELLDHKINSNLDLKSNPMEFAGIKIVSLCITVKGLLRRLGNIKSLVTFHIFR